MKTLEEGGGPSNGLMAMSRWMGSHFHHWVGYNDLYITGLRFQQSYY